MRTYNFALTTVVFLVVGGLIFGFWGIRSPQMSGLIEERATSGVRGPALVQTAQGANLDVSQITSTNSVAFSSLVSVSDLTNDVSGVALSVLYSSGAIKDSAILPVH